MAKIAQTYPEYGFEKHFGYPTPEHLEALKQHGPCPIHRRSFGPVAAFYQATLF
jgi:ribonuclease HII